MEPQTPGSIVLLVRLARVVYRRASEDLLGIRLKELATLSYLRDEEAAGRTTAQQGLIEALCIDANACVHLLNDLEDAGRVERRRDPMDRRRHVVRITPAGHEALEGAEHALSTIEDDVLSALSPKERTALHGLLAQALTDQP